jgi:hypothetical protein
MMMDFADFAVFADLYNDTGEKWEADGDADDAGLQPERAAAAAGGGPAREKANHV